MVWSLVDADGVVRLVNTRAERLLGRPRGLLLGGAVTDVLPLTDHAGRSWWDVASPWVGLPTRSGHRERVLTVPGAGSLVVSMRYVRPVRSGPVERVVISLREVRVDAGPRPPWPR
ncbi:MAG: PAS domain-containing protein [Austwickia sp.]|nr:PAS domain-containing protein [Austwickia sp.]